MKICIVPEYEWVMKMDKNNNEIFKGKLNSENCFVKFFQK